MLKQYIFLHNYNFFIKHLPTWKDDDRAISNVISYGAWTKLSHAYAHKIQSKNPSLSGEGTVKEMLRAYALGVLDIGDAPNSLEIKYHDLVFHIRVPYNTKFARSKRRGPATLAGTMLDDGPYSDALLFYVQLKNKYVARELVLVNGTKARRISTIAIDAKGSDMLDFTYATTVFTKYLIDERGYSCSYRILPKSETDSYYYTCFDEVTASVPQPILPVKQMRLDDTFIKYICGEEWRRLDVDMAREVCYTKVKT